MIQSRNVLPSGQHVVNIQINITELYVPTCLSIKDIENPILTPKSREMSPHYLRNSNHLHITPLQYEKFSSRGKRSTVLFIFYCSCLYKFSWYKLLHLLASRLPKATELTYHKCCQHYKSATVAFSFLPPVNNSHFINIHFFQSSSI